MEQLNRSKARRIIMTILYQVVVYEKNKMLYDIDELIKERNEKIEILSEKLKEEEIVKFLLNGAQPTRTVKSILVKAGVWAKFEEAKKR